MTAKELYEKYQSDLAELQSKCTHPKKSDWMQQQWAPAHSTGYTVRVCEICGMVIDKQPEGDIDWLKAFTVE